MGEPTSPLRLAPARGPQLWERADAGNGEFDPQAQPVPEWEFNQHIAGSFDEDRISLVGKRS